jgi:NhaC family Na+:H+ antiporter
VYLFGSDASYGANQIALVLATAVAALVGQRTGIELARHARRASSTVSGSASDPTLILLAVGMLIGTWILSGTVPTMIYYGVQILNPHIFYAASAVICAIVAISVGSSWTVAGTLGIGLMGIAGSFDLSPADRRRRNRLRRVLRRQALADVRHHQPRRRLHRCRPVRPHPPHAVDHDSQLCHRAAGVLAHRWRRCHAAGGDPRSCRKACSREFNIGLHLLLPLALMLFLVYKRFPCLPGDHRQRPDRRGVRPAVPAPVRGSARRRRGAADGRSPCPRACGSPCLPATSPTAATLSSTRC